MLARIDAIENAARIALGTEDGDDPLPPGPNYGPFGYFRLSILIFAAVIVVLAIATFV